MDHATRAQRGFARFTVWLFWITLFVILFGAVVRITGSGAGCGQHWPTCHGELVHLPASIDTAIELTHRATSGIDFLLTIALVVWACIAFPRGRGVRLSAGLALLFMISEALLGARLVLANLVGIDASLSRATTMAAHLVNTSLLTGAMAATWWWAQRDGAERRSPNKWLVGVIVALFAILAVNITGAITALGDTVFPVVAEGRALSERLQADLAETAPFLRRARIVHPLLALSCAAYIAALAWRYSIAHETPHPRRQWALRVAALVVGQSLIGVVNIMLSAPGWMQVLHLAVATCLWVSLLIWGFELRYDRS